MQVEINDCNDINCSLIEVCNFLGQYKIIPRSFLEGLFKPVTSNRETKMAFRYEISGEEIKGVLFKK